MDTRVYNVCLCMCYNSPVPTANVMPNKETTAAKLVNRMMYSVERKF